MAKPTNSTMQSLRGFKPYPTYKDSGVEWLGKIPAHWEAKRLKFVTKILAGQSPPSDTVHVGEDGLPFIQGNAEFGQMHPAPKLVCDSAPKRAQSGALLLSVRAPVGAVNIADRITGIGRGLCAIHVKEELNCGFAFYLLLTIRKDLETVATGSTYDAVTSSDVGNLPALVPPAAEQHAIASFLDRETEKIDALVAKNERLIELLQEKRTALITRAVTKGLDPNVPMRDSGVEWLGDIPAHWDVQRIKWSARMESGHTPDKKVESYWLGGNIPWVSLADTQQLREVDNIQDTAVMTTEDGIAHSSAHLLPAGTVVFSRDATIGLCAITQGDMAVSQHFIGWVCGPRLRPEYLLFVLRSMTQELERLTMGATVLTIGMPDVRSLASPIPPKPEQEEIVAYVHKHRAQIDGLVAKVREGIEKLKEYRAALISAAVTGKIDVRRGATG